MVLVLMAAVMLLASCSASVSIGGPEDEKVPAQYKDFYKYPNGRIDASGTLRIENTMNSPALLFMNDVLPANYIGTVPGLNSIKVSLPEQKFYTIVAVDKKNWEEKGDQAERYSDLTYFSKTQAFSMTVHVSALYGGGKWTIGNRTNYWVSFKKADGSGEILAAIPPNTLRMTVPIQFNKAYDVVPHFYRELKFENVIVGLAESDDVRQANTIFVTSSSPNFNTDIGSEIAAPSANIKPAIFATNGFTGGGNSFRVYFGTNNQLSFNGIEDYILTSGVSTIFSGLADGTNANQINFHSIALGYLPVKQDVVMKKNYVYKINIRGTTKEDYTTTVEEVEAEDFYN